VKITVMQPTTIECTAIRCWVPCRYQDKDVPYDFPHREGDVWDVTIDIDTGKIHDWPKNYPSCDVTMKVCDEGVYTLLNGDKVVKKLEYYVPGCVPGSYGDYIEFEIDETGRITNWDASPAEVADSFFPQAE